jgi:hypothetical protein
LRKEEKAMRLRTAALLGTLIVIALILILVPLPIGGQTPTPSGPSDVNPPAGAKRALEASAEGVQIYTCKEENGQYSWAFTAPEAKLSDTHGKPLGRHFACPAQGEACATKPGPTWAWNDKSAVTGKRLKSVDSPYKDAIPWLLLEAVDHSGKGRLSQVTYIQRVDTKGGKPPATGCDVSRATQEARVAYSAKYVFYKSKPAKPAK